MGDVSREDFSSGKCFTGAVSSDTGDTGDTTRHTYVARYSVLTHPFVVVKCTASNNKKFISFRGALGRGALGNHGQQVSHIVSC